MKDLGGSLTVVGSGIQVVRDMTIGAKMAIERADIVLAVLTTPVAELYIKKLNQNIESLMDCYEEGVHRSIAYNRMIKRILSYVRDGLNVCAVFYGHPGIFAYPSHESIRQALKEGYSARMLPGISAEDCLFADLNIDPATNGCQSFEATDFLVFKRRIDPSSLLILWQIGMTGFFNYTKSNYSYNKIKNKGFKVLVEALRKYYDDDHETIIYEASSFPIGNPIIQHISLAKIPDARITAISTLCIPPTKKKLPDKNILNDLDLHIGKYSISNS